MINSFDYSLENTLNLAIFNRSYCYNIVARTRYNNNRDWTLDNNTTYEHTAEPNLAKSNRTGPCYRCMLLPRRQSAKRTRRDKLQAT